MVPIPLLVPVNLENANEVLKAVPHVVKVVTQPSKTTSTLLTQMKLKSAPQQASVPSSPSKRKDKPVASAQ